MDYIEVGNTLRVITSEGLKTVSTDDERYDDIFQAIEDDDEERFLDIIGASTSEIEAYIEGTPLEFEDNTLWYDEEEVGHELSDTIYKHIDEGRDPERFVKFLGNLYQNPNKQSVDELYKFMQDQQLPVTPEGTLKAYKSIRHDYTDHHTGTFNNRPGQSHEMPRNKVDPDPQRGCSYGFHVGSIEYAVNFRRGKLVVVEVNPKDVVAVPNDDTRKMRVCKYTVVRELDEDEINALLD